MKLIYRVLILFAVFTGAVFFFAQGMTERFFDEEKEVMKMSEPTFPIVSMQVQGIEVNALHGYAANLDEMIMRESITPLGSDRTFTVLIDENESIVKKIKYELLDENGQELESDSQIVLDTGEERKSVAIQIRENLKSGEEYVIKLTLITNQSKRIYYFTRIKLYDNGHLSEKLEFVMGMHRSLFDKEAALQYERYLEPSSGSDKTSYAYVDIHSDFELATYGELEPQLIFEAVPTITEFYENMASMVLDYVISVETEYGTELYQVEEKFRFNYTSSRVYLYNYERTMEALYEPERVSLTQNEFKLGITADLDAQTMASESRSYAAFVYGRTLMLYSQAANELIEIFSFRQGNEDYLRDLYDEHEVRILNVSEEGNVDFIVFGYMNRGEYEGRVGILLYRYYADDVRIEEQAYLPVNSSYQLLKEDMGSFVYRNGYDIFFFTMYTTIYSYNLVTRELTAVADNVSPDNVVYNGNKGYAAWQENSDITKSGKLMIMDLSQGTIREIKAPGDSRIRLYGSINDNLVYGYARLSDIFTYADGNIFLPSYRICICDSEGNVLKDYSKEGFHIADAVIGENIIDLIRVVKNSDGSYSDAEGDYVLNRYVSETPAVYVNRRVTDRMLTEYYISLPESMDIETQPTIRETRNTVIDKDATVRVSQPETEEKVYYAYSFGKVVYSSDVAAESIAAANANVGTVIDKNGRLVWERGVKSSHREITGITVVRDNSLTTIQACMKMLLAYKNVDADTSGYDTGLATIAGWLEPYMKATPIELTGSTLDEVLYYVYKQRPVIALKPDKTACLIIAYNQSSITVADPGSGNQVRYLIKDASEMFESAGNRFISYVE